MPPYEPITRQKVLTFSDLRIGDTFFFFYDLDRIGKTGTHVKVADDAYIEGAVGARGTFTCLQRISNLKIQYWHSPVERCGMMSEHDYESLTAIYR